MTERPMLTNARVELIHLLAWPGRENTSWAQRSRGVVCNCRRRLPPPLFQKGTNVSDLAC
jgi:hypothetical protein